MLENQLELKKRRLLLVLLNDLENALVAQGLWQANKPSEAALASTAPFAIDTLSFAQWLQFIFIDKMSYLLQFSMPLPQSMLVLPMAEQYFNKQAINSAQIVNTIRRIDLLISDE